MGGPPMGPPPGGPMPGPPGVAMPPGAAMAPGMSDGIGQVLSQISMVLQGILPKLNPADPRAAMIAEVLQKLNDATMEGKVTSAQNNSEKYADNFKPLPRFTDGGAGGVNDTPPPPNFR